MAIIASGVEAMAINLANPAEAAEEFVQAALVADLLAINSATHAIRALLEAVSRWYSMPNKKTFLILLDIKVAKQLQAL